MAEGRKRLERAVRTTLDAKKDKPRLYKGLLGAYVNGVQTVAVAERPDFVYVRLRGATGEVILAFNDNVAEVWDLPVLVIRDERFPNIWRIEGRDIGQYGDWGGASYIPPHGRSHSFTASGADTGSDPVWVFKRQFMPLMPRPNASGTNTIFIEADYYFWEGRYRYWPGSGTDDLLQFRPTGGGAGRFVTIFLRGDEGIPDYLVGPEFSLIFPPTDPIELIEVPDQDVGIPIAAISLQTGTERIGWQEIYDLRLAPSMLPGTGAQLGIWDEGVPVGSVGTINFIGENVEAIVSGTFAWVSVTGTVGGGDGGASGTVVVYDEIALLGSADTLRFFGAGVEVVLSGTFAHVSVPGGGGDGGGIGVFGLDDGVPLGTGTSIDWGDDLDASISGSRLRIDATHPPFPPFPEELIGVFALDSGVPLGTGTTIDFRDNLTATISGSFITVDGQAGGDGGGGAGADLNVLVREEGQFIVTGTLDFVGDGVDVSVSGSVARVEISAAGVVPIMAVESFLATGTDSHTALNTWEDVAGMSGTITLDRTSDIICHFHANVEMQSNNWQIWRFKFVLDGSIESETTRYQQNANAAVSQNPVRPHSFHTVFPNVSPGTHGVKVQWNDNNSNLDLDIYERRMTVLAPIGGTYSP